MLNSAIFIDIIVLNYMYFTIKMTVQIGREFNWYNSLYWLVCNLQKRLLCESNLESNSITVEKIASQENRKSRRLRICAPSSSFSLCMHMVLTAVKGCKLYTGYLLKDKNVFLHTTCFNP